MDKCTVSGKPADPDCEYAGVPQKEKLADGQHIDHYVLCDEDRAASYIRPLRTKYKHVGLKEPTNIRPLTDEEQERYAGLDYAWYEEYTSDKLPKLGKFWTLKEMERVNNGCGCETTMPIKCAETYSINPRFYSSTFCCWCKTYLPVGENGEFVWLDDGTRVGT